MTSQYPTRRTGLGRRVADIVSGADDHREAAPGGLLSAPAVVPLDLVPFPMLVADPSGRVLAANQRWTRLTGLTMSQSLGSGWLSAVAATERTGLRSLVQQVGRGAPVHGADYPLVGAPGARVGWWLASQERAGQRLVGIAVGAPAVTRQLPQPKPQCSPRPARLERSSEPAPRGDPAPAAGPDPVLDELPGLLLSVRGLIDMIDLLVARLPPLEVIPA